MSEYLGRNEREKSKEDRVQVAWAIERGQRKEGNKKREEGGRRREEVKRGK